MFRYAQFCPLARATEILGQRWNLLILRELFVGPQRFSDLRRRLGGEVSSSVLASRLVALEGQGVLALRTLAPPAATTVYALTPDGEALWPAFRELVRWGVRYLVRQGMQEGDHMEPDWVVLALRVFARDTPTPARRLELRIPGTHGDHVARYQGGARGTCPIDDSDPVEAILCAEAAQMLPLIAGVIDPEDAARNGVLAVEGDLEAARALPELFEVDLGIEDLLVQSTAPPTNQASQPGHEGREGNLT